MPSSIQDAENLMQECLALEEPVRSAALEVLADQLRRTAWNWPARLMANTIAAQAEALIDHKVDLLTGQMKLVSGYNTGRLKALSRS